MKVPPTATASIAITNVRTPMDEPATCLLSGSFSEEAGSSGGRDGYLFSMMSRIGERFFECGVAAPCMHCNTVPVCLGGAIRCAEHQKEKA